MGQLDGKVAIITGGGGHIGRGIACAFVKEGAKVVLAEKNPEAARAAAEEVRQLGGKALAVECDVGDEKQVKRMVEQAVATFGPIDILVNTAQSRAGGSRTHPMKPVESFPEECWDESFRSAVKGTWYCCKAVFPSMKDRGGKIINFGSLAGIEGFELQCDYASTKEAIRGFSRTAAREWGKYKINVNVICPASVTPQKVANLASTAGVTPEQFIESWTDRQSIKGLGDPEKDIGCVAVFLASPDSDFITGHTFMVDGGAHMF